MVGCFRERPVPRYPNAEAGAFRALRKKKIIRSPRALPKSEDRAIPKAIPLMKPVCLRRASVSCAPARNLDAALSRMGPGGLKTAVDITCVSSIIASRWLPVSNRISGLR
jgi:hypothetical protein